MISNPSYWPRWVSLSSAAATGILVALPYSYAGLYLLTWVAFVPMLVVVQGRSLRFTYSLGLMMGLVMYLVATPWMVEFLQRLKDYGFWSAFAGAAVFWLATAQLPALLMVTYRIFQQLVGQPVLWVFPPLMMLFYGWFPVLFPLQMGESQSAFLPAIQGVALTGVYGLDFMIGISNALIAAAILVHRESSGVPSPGRGPIVGGAAVAMLVAWLGYGWWALDDWDQRIQPWPSLTVGLVQPNETPQAKVPPPEPGYARSWPPEMEISRQLAEQGAEVLLWPETRYKGYFEKDHVRASFQRNVAALGVPLLFHDTEQQGRGEEFREHNSAAMLDSDGVLAGIYRKHRLVAFGETLPLSREFPWLVAWSKRYLGEFFADMAPGTERISFPVKDTHLVPAICYESAFPGHVARSVSHAPASSLLVVMSNNGWFGDSRQPFQHSGATILRAVENRVSLVHVINNGPSTVVAPSGRILAATPFREATGLLSHVPHAPAGERHVSWFTRWPEWFPVSSGILLLVAMITVRVRSWSPHRGEG